MTKYQTKCKDKQRLVGGSPFNEHTLKPILVIRNILPTMELGLTVRAESMERVLRGRTGGERVERMVTMIMIIIFIFIVKAVLMRMIILGCAPFLMTWN